MVFYLLFFSNFKVCLEMNLTPEGLTPNLHKK
jgi:hypothetical protein